MNKNCSDIEYNLLDLHSVYFRTALALLSEGALTTAFKGLLWEPKKQNTGNLTQEAWEMTDQWFENL